MICVAICEYHFCFVTTEQSEIENPCNQYSLHVKVIEYTILAHEYHFVSGSAIKTLAQILKNWGMSGEGNT